MRDNPIASSVDFAQDGIQHGHLKLPYSRDKSAWGAVMIPVTVVQNGQGPTALLTGANHGDEYEGPIALFDLARSLRPDDVSGRVILVPAMNYPAFQAGTRTSPIDSGNLNRTFPGRPDGGVTEKIADYFQRTLLPLADYVLDIHSGGRTLEFIPFAASHALQDHQQEAACSAARNAFGAPWSLKLLELDSVGMFDSAVEEAGKIFVSTELGGGGTSRASINAITKRGVRNFLIHAGIMRGEIAAQPGVELDMPDGDCFVTAMHSGMIEPCVDLGEEVKKGDLIARIYDVERTGSDPVDYHAARSGILAGRHFPGLVQAGDTVAVIAVAV
ncbi:MAG: N(2)-acetyl-L-2,4-diaminobutanoate deacetylase DoeB [Fimbriimonadaceae bacterium]|nr:N(2)-acetyl-L-2,4-diaminobutanoate deacetylase DoeB [Alphaproteobacteria bacterium]